ncbi:MAG: zinc ribbon domain-containing protein [Planctomycetaceae bacterium]|nr:zinc ribbon domain-containing protein [Planctomycetaceae bacterium]
MPIFEFVCEECHKESELLVSLRETPDCPHCGSKKLEKLMSTSAGHVGSGSALPITSACPPPSAGPCGPGCCRHAH